MTSTRVGASEPLLRVETIDVSYGEAAALFGVSLDVDARMVGALIGPNGAGKSTLLKAILGVVGVRRGRVLFDGEDITRLSVPKTVRRGVTLVPEGRELFPGLSVMENLELGRFVAANRASSTVELLDWIFELFPVLAERRQQPAGSLSGGEQQMAAIGRALMSEPKLLMLDEPSLGLAPKMVERIVNGIAKATEDFDMAVLMVEQNIGAAAALADRLVVMNVGRVVSQRDAEGEEGFDIEELTAMYWGKQPPERHEPVTSGNPTTRTTANGRS